MATPSPTRTHETVYCLDITLACCPTALMLGPSLTTHIFSKNFKLPRKACGNPCKALERNVLNGFFTWIQSLLEGGIQEPSFQNHLPTYQVSLATALTLLFKKAQLRHRGSLRGRNLEHIFTPICHHGFPRHKIEQMPRAVGNPRAIPCFVVIPKFVPR